MTGGLDALTFIYGLLFAAILIVKYFKDRQIQRSALMMFIWGFAALVVGGFLAFMVSLGSRTGAVVVGAIFAAGSGVLLVIGLFMEFLGGVGLAPRVVAPPPPPYAGSVGPTGPSSSGPGAPRHPLHEGGQTLPQMPQVPPGGAGPTA